MDYLTHASDVFTLHYDSRLVILVFKKRKNHLQKRFLLNSIEIINI